MKLIFGSCRLRLLGWSVTLAASAFAACPANHTPTVCYESNSCPWVTDPATCTCTSCGWDFQAVASGEPGRRATASEFLPIICVRNVCKYYNGVAVCDATTPYHSTYIARQTYVTKFDDCVGGVPW